MNVGGLEPPVEPLRHGLVPAPDGVVEGVGADGLFQVPGQNLDSGEGG